METIVTDLEKAVGEALSYNRMGALDRGVLEDVAYDYDVEPREILEKLEWNSIWDSDENKSVSIENI